MGLFDKVLGAGSSSALSRPEAFAGVMLAVMSADGHISDDEAQGFLSVVKRLKLFQAQSASEHHAMMDKLFGILKRNDAEHLLTKAAEALPGELRESAFAVAADLVFADGCVDHEEQQVLEKLQSRLKVPDELAIQVVRVMQIKNRN